MKPIINMWMQPIYARLNLESRKSLFWIIGIALLFGQLLAALIFVGGRDKHGVEIFFYALLFSLAAILSIVSMAWFVMLVQYIGQQFSAANAGLVPRFKMYAQWAIALPIVATAIIVNSVFWVLEQRFSMWPAFVCVMIMSSFAISVRSPWMIAPLIFSFQLPSMLDPVRYQKLEVIFSSSRLDAIGLLLLAMLLILIVGLRWLFAVRGDAVFAMHKRSLMFKDGINGKRAHESRLTLGFSMLFFQWMAQSVNVHLKNIDKPKSSLLVFSLGPRLHWSTIVTQLVGVCVAGFAAVFLLRLVLLRDSRDFLLGFGLGFGGILAIMLPVLISLLLFFTMYQTRTEQALLSLAPNLGNSRVRNSQYIGYLLKQFLILYFFSVVGACLFSFFVESSATKKAILALVVACLFPLILSIGVRFSHMRSVQDHPLMKLLLACVLLFVTGLSLVLLISPVIAWFFCPAVIVVSSLMLWKKIQINLQTDMFPAGRAV